MRHLAPATWSLVPAWSSTDRFVYPTFNARIETALTKRTWSDSARGTRALIPMTGYYERAKDHSPGISTRPTTLRCSPQGSTHGGVAS